MSYETLKGCRNPALGGPGSNAIEIDDVIAAVLERFWISVTRFKSQSKNGLNAYIRKAIAGAASDTMLPTE